MARSILRDTSQPPHGTARRYERGCRCDDCRRANAERRRRYERRTGYGAAYQRALNKLRHAHLAEFNMLFEVELAKGTRQENRVRKS